MLWIVMRNYAERKNRAARFRSEVSTTGATVGVAVFRRANGYNCSAINSAEAMRCCGSFARHLARISSSSFGIDAFTCDGGSGREEST